METYVERPPKTKGWAVGAISSIALGWGLRFWGFRLSAMRGRLRLLVWIKHWSVDLEFKGKAPYPNESLPAFALPKPTCAKEGGDDQCSAPETLS